MLPQVFFEAFRDELCKVADYDPDQTMMINVRKGTATPYQRPGGKYRAAPSSPEPSRSAPTPAAAPRKGILNRIGSMFSRKKTSRPSPRLRAALKSKTFDPTKRLPLT